MREFLRRLFQARIAGPSAGKESLHVAAAGQRRAEAGLRRSDEHFEQVVAGVRDYAVFLLNREGRVATWNAGAERIKGYKADEIIGQHFSQFYPDEAMASGLPAHELRVASATGRFEDEGWRVRKDGSQFWANVVITALRGDSGEVRGFLKITRDLTERKQAEDNARRLLQEEAARRAAESVAIENARLCAQLRETDRLKDEFLAMLAHELRNPLAPIRNALHILKQPAANGATHQRVRDMAERQVQHMARLLDDLLDVSRISRGCIRLHREPVDVTSLITRTVDAIRPLIEERRHELTLSLPAGPLRLEGDPLRLEQVLTNLLNNAAKYTDPGGHIWLTAERAGGEVVLRVRDTGMGIAPEILPHVFDLFVQAERRLDRSQGGVGIGLTLVKRLVELHGGHVEAASGGPGWGSEFTVRLPALPDSRTGELARDSGDEDAAELPRRRVLVVDDNQDAADSLTLLLRLAGQDVSTAYDGPTALVRAAEVRPELAFLDIGLPGMDGYEVARRLRAEPRHEGVILVALTGWGQEEDRRRSTEAGFDHHLVKPVEPAVVRKVLADPKSTP